MPPAAPASAPCRAYISASFLASQIKKAALRMSAAIKPRPAEKKAPSRSPPPPQDIPARKQKSLPVQGGVKTNEGKKKARRLPTFPPREAVSSALESLTSVFGMGTGISSPLWPPDNVYKSSFCPPACGSRRRGRTLFYAKGLLRKARLPAESTIWSSLTTY